MSFFHFSRAGLAGILFLLIAICPAWAVVKAPVSVFVSISPQKYFVERIGGDRVQVEVLVRPEQKPDSLDLTPRQVAHLGRCHLYFLMGVPFEDAWLPRIQNIYPELKVVALHSDKLKTIQAAHTESSHHHRHEYENPHRWLNPRWVRFAADNILQALVQEDPSSAVYYRKNHRRFIRELIQLDREIKSLLKPVQNRTFLAYHPAWSHFAKSYGLKEIPIEQEGKEPGPRSLANVVQQGRDHGVKVVFVQKQYSGKVVAPLAEALKAKIVMVDPLAENYIENMREVARVFAGAMK